ncbi:MAG: glucose-6-phosphate dehydrogenase, partial [Pseudomonadota bacterium]
MVSQTIPVQDFDLTIFGATGDLAKRKILPALFRRMRAGQFGKNCRIIGAARSDYDTDGFRDETEAALRKHIRPEGLDEALLKQFLGQLDYLALDIFTDDGWKKLAAKQRDGVIRAYYFSVGPSLFGEIARRLHAHGMTDETSRIVVEKPFGRDLESAKALNTELRACFGEDQIYRIDHYLGKETVQNLMAVRFGNALFEPLWNATHIDHIQITASESLGVEGRGPYYDKSGAMRDMVQNHLMQLLCLTAMEPPNKFEANAVRDEKLKVISGLEAITEENIVRGQYIAAGDAPGYLEEVKDENSITECFVALKAEVANWRWSGVPFYLRTGKRLRHRMTEIAIQFKAPPHSIFGNLGYAGGNLLKIRLQPDEGMTLSVTIKDPGPGGMRLREVPLDMTFAEALGDEIDDTPDAYERLIMDVIRGNQTLFMRGDEVEAAWQWVDP